MADPKPLEACYGLQGSDVAALDGLRDRLQQRVIADNGTVEVVRDRSAGELAALIGQAGLSFGPRLVVVVDAHRYKQPDAKKIAAALGAPAPDTVVCLIGAGGPLPAALAAACKTSGGLVDRDVAADPATQVTGAAKRAGVRLTPDAVAALAAIDDLPATRLARELDKLAVFSDGEPVDAATVSQLCVFDLKAAAQPWALLDAVAARDPRGCVRELGVLWHAGEQPARIAGLVKGRLRRLSQARALADRGAGPQAVAQVTDSKPWQATKLIAAAKKWTLAELALASRRMEAAERDVWAAGGGPGGRLVLERALPAVCNIHA